MPSFLCLLNNYPQNIINVIQKQIMSRRINKYEIIIFRRESFIISFNNGSLNKREQLEQLELYF